MRYGSKILEISKIIFKIFLEDINIEKIEIINDKDIEEKEYEITKINNTSALKFNEIKNIKYVKIIIKDNFTNQHKNLEVNYYKNDELIASINRELNKKIIYLNIPDRR